MQRRNENQRNWAHVWILAYKMTVLSQSWKMTRNISATTITFKGINPALTEQSGQRSCCRQPEQRSFAWNKTRCNRCYGRYLQEIRDYSVVLLCPPPSSFGFILGFCLVGGVVLKAHLPLPTKREKLEVCRTSISSLRITWILFFLIS